MDTKPSTFYHTDAVRKINTDLRNGKELIDLSEHGLLTDARNETGLQRFGDESFLPSFRVLLTHLEDEAELNPFGRMMARIQLLGSLKNRLWANACFEAHPEILNRKIIAPIVVLGQARSGTTRLQRLLAADPNMQHLKTWECINPAPRTLPTNAFEAAVRREEVVQRIKSGQQINPGADAAHPMHPDWAEEEIILLRHSFGSMQPFGFFPIPRYYQWFLKQDRSEAYAYMADLLKLVSWSRGDPEEKPWVLKTPQHMLDLDRLIQIFPDAKLPYIHRDPVKTNVSTVSLMWNFCVQYTDRPCREIMRDIWLDCCEQMARRSIDVRRQIPNKQQFDVYYEDMNRDWRSVMKSIYSFAEMEFTPEIEEAMATWLNASEGENRHGGHRYSAQDFGVSNADVDKQMMFYRIQYNIPYERK